MIALLIRLSLLPQTRLEKHACVREEGAEERGDFTRKMNVKGNRLQFSSHRVNRSVYRQTAEIRNTNADRAPEAPFLPCYAVGSAFQNVLDHLRVFHRAGHFRYVV